MGEESAGPSALEVAAAARKAAGLTLSTCMWESRRETAKFYSSVWTSSSIKPVASRLPWRAGRQLLDAAPAGSRSHFSLGAAILGGFRSPSAQPACQAENKRERTCATAAGERRKKTKRNLAFIFTFNPGASGSGSPGGGGSGSRRTQRPGPGLPRRGQSGPGAGGDTRRAPLSGWSGLGC